MVRGSKGGRGRQHGLGPNQGLEHAPVQHHPDRYITRMIGLAGSLDPALLPTQAVYKVKQSSDRRGRAATLPYCTLLGGGGGAQTKMSWRRPLTSQYSR